VHSIVQRARGLIVGLQDSVPGKVLRRYTEDQGWFLGAAVAYNALFSMFPIILLMAALLGAALSNSERLSQAIALIASVLPPELSEPVADLVSESTQEAGLFGVASLLGLLYVSVGLFNAFEEVLDRIYRVPERSFVAQRLMGLMMIVIFTVLIVLQVVAFSVAQILVEVMRAIPLVGADFASFLPLVGYVVSAGAAFLLCFAFFYVVPNVRLRFRETVPGTLFASVALMLIVQLFPLYARLAQGTSSYGQAFGFALLMMTWSYLVAHAFILGAELNVIICPPVRQVVGDLLAAVEEHAEHQRER
jgi:membrane protein